MSLTHQDVARIARLAARIAVTEDEIAATSEKLNGIFGLIEEMQAVNTDGIEPMAHPQDVFLRLREDAVTEPNRREAPSSRWPWAERACSWCRRSSNDTEGAGLDWFPTRASSANPFRALACRQVPFLRRSPAVVPLSRSCRATSLRVRSRAWTPPYLDA